MPLYLDVHTIDGGVSASDVADAHMKDLETQEKYGVDYKRYWVDEEGRSSASSRHLNAEAANRVHREATASSLTRSTR